MRAPAGLSAMTDFARRAATLFAALLALALVGFWPSYLSKPFAGIDRYTHLHAALATLWFALLIAQPLLLRAGRRSAHRALGRVSFALAPAFVAASLLLAHQRFAAMDEARFREEGMFFYLPAFSALLFALCWGGGIVWRHVPSAHARLMAGTAMTLIAPVLARVVGFYGPQDLPLWANDLVSFGATDAALLALWAATPARDVPGRRAATGMLVLFVACHVGWFTLARSPAWFEIARAFRALPLT